MKNPAVLRYGAVAAPLIFALSGSGLSWGASPLPVEPTDCASLSGDAAIAAAIRTRLLRSAAVETGDIEIIVLDGQVSLRGQARSHAQRLLAGELAGDTQGVLRVVNQLDVIDWAPITDIARTQAQSRATQRAGAAVQSDAWISAAVAQALRTSRGIGTCDIQVATRDGVVTLQGEVGSSAARDRAVALAGDTLGARRVDALRLTIR